MKQESKREQKRNEKLRQENIEKFDEEYKKSKVIPKEYKKKIKNRVLKNSSIALIAIIYLIAINWLSLKLETQVYITIIKILCIFGTITSVVFLELSYRKDNGYIFMHGIEFLVLTTVTLFSEYAYVLFYKTYNIILACILMGIVVYYIIKTIVTIKYMKRDYYNSLNDIKEIVKKK